jgi:hypothetical protein
MTTARKPFSAERAQALSQSEHLFGVTYDFEPGEREYTEAVQRLLGLEVGTIEAALMNIAKGGVKAAGDLTEGDVISLRGTPAIVVINRVRDSHRRGKDHVVLRITYRRPTTRRVEDIIRYANEPILLADKPDPRDGPVSPSGIDRHPFTVVGHFRSGKAFVEHFDAASGAHAAKLCARLHRGKGVKSHIVEAFEGHLDGKLGL